MFSSYFGHSIEHNGESFVIAANDENNDAIVIGGSRYTLKELAGYCGFNIEDYKLKDKKLRQWTYLTKERFLDPQILNHFSHFDPKLNHFVFNVLNEKGEAENQLRYIYDPKNNRLYWK